MDAVPEFEQKYVYILNDSIILTCTKFRLTVRANDLAMKNGERIGCTGTPDRPNWPENRELSKVQQLDEVQIPSSLRQSMKISQSVGSTWNSDLLLRKLEMSSSCGMLSAL